MKEVIKHVIQEIQNLEWEIVKLSEQIKTMEKGKVFEIKEVEVNLIKQVSWVGTGIYSQGQSAPNQMVFEKIFIPDEAMEIILREMRAHLSKLIKKKEHLEKVIHIDAEYEAKYNLEKL